jgi:hypothetical protein
MVRFYFDADVLGLAKVIVSLRSDVTYPPETREASYIDGSGHRVPSLALPRSTRTGFRRLLAKGG